MNSNDDLSACKQGKREARIKHTHMKDKPLFVVGLLWSWFRWALTEWCNRVFFSRLAYIKSLNQCQSWSFLQAIDWNILSSFFQIYKVKIFFFLELIKESSVVWNGDVDVVDGKRNRVGRLLAEKTLFLAVDRCTKAEISLFHYTERGPESTKQPLICFTFPSSSPTLEGEKAWFSLHVLRSRTYSSTLGHYFHFSEKLK